MHSYACKEFDELRLHINHMIDKQQYEEAALYLAEKYDTDIAQGYGSLASMIRIHFELKNRKKLSEIYLVKGCKLGDYTSCRELTNNLIKNGEYLKAEAALLDIVDKHSDPKAAGYLVSLYHNRKWDGFSKEKAKYWQYKISELVKEKSNN